MRGVAVQDEVGYTEKTIFTQKSEQHMTFVHLRTHTGYSMKDGIIDIDQALEKAKNDNMPALAVTDLHNVMAAVKFHQAARKAGVKPILGVDLTLKGLDEKSPNSRFTMLVQSEAGYHNLNKILSRAYVEGKDGDMPLISREWLESMKTEGLIALSGATEGGIGQKIAAGELDAAKAEAAWFSNIFKDDRFFLELQRDGRKGQEDYIEKAVSLASELDIPVVATHMNQFLNPDDHDAHDTRVVVADQDRLDNPNRVKRFTREQYFKTTAEMNELFSDIPVALENTEIIAKRCNFAMTLGKTELPRFPTEAGETEAQALRRLSQAGMERRLIALYPDETVRESKRQKYQDRLDVELGVIDGMGFPGYFLIVQDFINWAKEKDIPVGPGRGSGASSLVAYSLRITDLDPLAFDLLFERFLNPERVSMPDFDIDFCRERRTEVVEYVREKYGYNSVAQIATTGAMESKAVIKDVARSMGIPPFVAQELSDLIPKVSNVPISLSRALQEVAKLKEKYETEPEMKKLFDLALKLEGTPRQFGMHAAGVVIAPREITDFTPLYYDGKGVTSHFDKDDVEKVGLVKFDFLGLDTLTIIHKAQKMIEKMPGNETFNIHAIPLNDEYTFDMFRKGNTSAVFQFESFGMQETLKNARPTRFEDLIALNALYRPGPIDSIPRFIACKHGDVAVEYAHPILEEILKPTYGVIVYQEQVMQIARELAGYSLGGADLLRRAMGKKKPEEMAAQREIFMKGAVARGASEAAATTIFDQMEKFSEYGFNKSHSAPYSWLAYQTAYLKTHYPQQFYAAAMTCKAEDGKFDKVADLVDDARKNGYKVLPPSINTSGYEFTPEGVDGVRFGLAGIKGVGESAALVIQEERKNSGSYEGFFECGARLGKGTINKRVKEALINSGAFDEFGHSRETLCENLEALQDFVDANEKARLKAQKTGGSALGELLGDEVDGSDVKLGKIILPVPEVKTTDAEWPLLERLSREHKVFDFYFSGHPANVHRKELGGLPGVPSIEDIMPGMGATYAAGVVVDFFERKAKKPPHDPWCSMIISDGVNEMDVTLFGENYQNVKSKLKAGNYIVVGGRVKDEAFQGKTQISAEVLYSRQEATMLATQFVKLAWNGDPEVWQKVEQILDAQPKDAGPLSSRVVVYLRDDAGTKRVDKGGGYQFQVNDETLKDIQEVLGEDAVRLHPYDKAVPALTLPERRSFGPKRKY